MLEPDDNHPRRSAKNLPGPEDVPARNRDSNDRPKKRYAKRPGSRGRWLEGILQMQGMGRKLFKGINPDEYVRKLREGWK